jgi:hypothetical protein
MCNILDLRVPLMLFFLSKGINAIKRILTIFKLIIPYHWTLDKFRELGIFLMPIKK